MKISTKGRYALRIMLDIAENDDGGYISLRDISEREGISIKYMEQIIPSLHRAGYLKSLRGNGGGYRLTKKPEDYVVGDILRVMEGVLAPVACLVDEINECERCDSCHTLKFWKGLQQTINQYVDSVTLKDLM